MGCLGLVLPGESCGGFAGTRIHGVGCIARHVFAHRLGERIWSEDGQTQTGSLVHRRKLKASASYGGIDVNPVSVLFLTHGVLRAVRIRNPVVSLAVSRHTSSLHVLD